MQGSFVEGSCICMDATIFMFGSCKPYHVRTRAPFPGADMAVVEGMRPGAAHASQCTMHVRLAAPCCHRITHTTLTGCVPACAEDPTWWPEADLAIVEGTRLGAAAAHQHATLAQLALWRDRLLQLRRRGPALLRIALLVTFQEWPGCLAPAFPAARAQLPCLPRMGNGQCWCKRFQPRCAGLLCSMRLLHSASAAQECEPPPSRAGSPAAQGAGRGGPASRGRLGLGGGCGGRALGALGGVVARVQPALPGCDAPPRVLCLRANPCAGLLLDASW